MVEHKAAGVHTRTVYLPFFCPEWLQPVALRLLHCIRDFFFQRANYAQLVLLLYDSGSVEWNHLHDVSAIIINRTVIDLYMIVHDGSSMLRLKYWYILKTLLVAIAV